MELSGMFFQLFAVAPTWRSGPHGGLRKSLRPAGPRDPSLAIETYFQLFSGTLGTVPRVSADTIGEKQQPGDNAAICFSIPPCVSNIGKRLARPITAPDSALGQSWAVAALFSAVGNLHSG
ncbi:hypothetical protein AAFF_G00253690 [Aldrovandia affinis]|uniref:Uncharacterized protein n=1 Tax=Aldrovandia affinis TaxID=143900 RepID=A0AAD7WUH3_9TELE|nr:hypothetical protein AAFF_G00253690 [Aldrovandia affinis]